MKSEIRLMYNTSNYIQNDTAGYFMKHSYDLEVENGAVHAEPWSYTVWYITVWVVALTLFVNLLAPCSLHMTVH
jgi:hypothetical protein